MTRSVVLIVPAAMRAAADALAESLGYGPATFGVALKTGGAVTHYGTHATAEDGGAFHQLVQAVASGAVPDALSAHADVLAAMIVSGRPLDDDTAAHFANACASAGLAWEVV